jgi:hypothetical protein
MKDMRMTEAKSGSASTQAIFLIVQSRIAGNALRQPLCCTPMRNGLPRPRAAPGIFGTILLGLWLAGPSDARGVSAYLPIDLSPFQARQLDMLFALADQPILRRPIPVALVEEAMSRACPDNPGLCESMQRWLRRYVEPAAVTGFEVEAAVADDSSVPLPNRHGGRSDDHWQLSAAAQWQPSPYLLLGAGAIARQGETTPTGTMLSVGGGYAQLDVGFRDRWLSPLRDSAVLMSTQAATMPSVGLSNSTPITRARVTYEFFLSRMSWSDSILDDGQFTSGHPLLAGMHLGIEPARGWSLGLTRQMQFGGGTRDSSPGGLFKAFFRPNHYDNYRPGRPPEFGNQQAAWSSSFIYPGAVPVIVSMEFAGEDTAHGTSGRLGNAGLSLGVYVPHLWRNLGLRYEISEWQNDWYTHGTYHDGLVNQGDVIGQWGADWRVPGNGIGARAQSLALQWDMRGGASLDVVLRTLRNQNYTAIRYRRATELGAQYSMPVGTLRAGGELTVGRDVMGDTYIRLAAFARGLEGSGGSIRGTRNAEAGASMFIDAGVALGKVHTSRDTPGSPSSTSAARLAPHLALGVRRAVSNRSDLGARIELDRVDEQLLVGLRAFDYRLRLTTSLALTAFAGAARYDAQTPAYGYYGGAGVQWRDIRPRWDLNLDLRYGDKLAHDELDANGRLAGNSDLFSDVMGATLSLSRRF